MTLVDMKYEKMCLPCHYVCCFIFPFVTMMLFIKATFALADPEGTSNRYCVLLEARSVWSPAQ